MSLGQGNAHALLSSRGFGQVQGLSGGGGLGSSGKGKQPIRKGSILGVGLVDHLSRSSKESPQEFDSAGFDAMINSAHALKVTGGLGALRTSGKMNSSGKASGGMGGGGNMNSSGKASGGMVGGGGGGNMGMGTWTMGDPAGLVPSTASSGTVTPRGQGQGQGNMAPSDSFRGLGGNMSSADDSFRGRANSRCEKVDEEEKYPDNDNRSLLGNHSEHSITSMSYRKKSPAMGSTTNSVGGNETPLISGNRTPERTGNRTPELGGKLPSIDSKKMEDLLAKLDHADRLVSNMKLLDKSYGRRNSVTLNDSTHSNLSANNSMHGGGSVSQKTPRRTNSIFSKEPNKDALMTASISTSSKNPSPARFRVAGGGSVIDLSPISSPQQQQAKLYCKLR